MTWRTSLVLWYSIVAFQWRKVWKWVSSSLGIKGAVPMVLTIQPDKALIIVRVGKAGPLRNQTKHSEPTNCEDTEAHSSDNAEERIE
jgi:hypothetical protein